jgi:hypothetical protein
MLDLLIDFKPSHRPKKSEKQLAKDINEFYADLPEDEKSGYAFKGEKVRSGDRLTEIWDILQGNPPESRPETKENSEENTNFANNTEDMFTDVIEEAQTVESSTEPKNEDPSVDQILEDGEDLDQVPTSFSPISLPKKEREYNRAENINVGEIPEPDFNSNKKSPYEQLEKEKEEREEIAEEIKQKEEEKEEAKPSILDKISNPAVNELDGKDKKLASKQLVVTVLDAYKMLHQLGQNYVQYPEDKLNQKVIKGEINPKMEIQVNAYGDTTNPVDFIQEFNKEAVEALEYDPTFDERVTPPMERVFAKRGWGMTDEQVILKEFGKDMGFKLVQTINLKKTASGYMDRFEELHQEQLAAIRKNGGGMGVNPDSITKPPPPPRPIVQEEEYVEDAQMADVPEMSITPVRRDEE